MAVDVAAEPTEQCAELSALDLLVEVRDVRSDPLHQLRADQVSDCVAGEDAEAHERPVDVLQRAYPIVGDVDAQVGTDARVPGFGQVLHLQLALQHLVLELEAKQHVHVVGDLVGLDADQ